VPRRLRGAGALEIALSGACRTAPRACVRRTNEHMTAELQRRAWQPHGSPQMRRRALWQFDCSAVLRPLGRRLGYSLACTTVGGRTPKALHAHNAQAVTCESSQIYSVGAARACHQAVEAQLPEAHTRHSAIRQCQDSELHALPCTHRLSACMHVCRHPQTGWHTWAAHLACMQSSFPKKTRPHAAAGRPAVLAAQLATAHLATQCAQLPPLLWCFERISAPMQTCQRSASSAAVGV
jgi:hypothetical protein